MARINPLYTAHVQGDGDRVVVARPAPADADYLVKTASTALTAERVVTDTATVTWDWSTPGQAKATAVGGAPSGAAGGSLGGTYPNPTVAKLNETSGPSALTIGAIADGQTLRRVGATIVGAWIALAYATSPMLEVGAPGSMLGAYTTGAGTVA